MSDKPAKPMPVVKAKPADDGAECVAIVAVSYVPEGASVMRDVPAGEKVEDAPAGALKNMIAAGLVRRVGGEA